MGERCDDRIPGYSGSEAQELLSDQALSLSRCPVSAVSKELIPALEILKPPAAGSLTFSVVFRLMASVLERCTTLFRTESLGQWAVGFLDSDSEVFLKELINIIQF